MESRTLNLYNVVGISLITDLQAKIQRLISSFYENSCNFRFSAAILQSLVVMDMSGLCHLIPQTYLGSVTKGFQFTPSGCKMAAKRSASWIIWPPVRLRGLTWRLGEFRASEVQAELWPPKILAQFERKIRCTDKLFMFTLKVVLHKRAVYTLRRVKRTY